MSTSYNIIELPDESTIAVDSHSRSIMLELDIDVPLKHSFITLELTPEQLLKTANKLKEVAEIYINKDQNVNNTKTT